MAVEPSGNCPVRSGNWHIQPKAVAPWQPTTRFALIFIKFAGFYRCGMKSSQRMIVSDRRMTMTAARLRTHWAGIILNKLGIGADAARAMFGPLGGGLRSVMLGLFVSALPLAAHSQTAPADPILTVLVTSETGGKAVQTQYDLAALQSLPKTSFATKTQWIEGVSQFEGVEIQALLATLQVTGGTMTATAADGYMIEIPVVDMLKPGPMIAYSMNGAPLPADKGPLWIVYPYDLAPEFNTDDTISRSIWQLQQIELTP
jgi:hypothetical protein